MNYIYTTPYPHVSVTHMLTDTNPVHPLNVHAHTKASRPCSPLLKAQ